MPDPILTFGATGESVDDLIALLQAAGHPPTRTLTPRERLISLIGLFDSGIGSLEEPMPLDILDGDVLAAVAAAQQELGVVEPAQIEPVPGTIITGTLIAQPTWDALRAAAAKRTGLVTSTVAADAQTKAAIEGAPEVSAPPAAPAATGAEAAKRAAEQSAAQAAAWQPPASEAEA